MTYNVFSGTLNPTHFYFYFANFLYMLFISVARSSSGMLTIGRIAYPREWVFFPIDNALYSIAFRTRTKTAKPIDMPFGVTSGSEMCCMRLAENTGQKNTQKISSCLPTHKFVGRYLCKYGVYRQSERSSIGPSELLNYF